MKRNIVYILLIFLFFFVLIKPSSDLINIILDVVKDVFVVVIFIFVFYDKQFLSLLIGTFLSVIVLNMEVIELVLFVNKINIGTSGFNLIKKIINYSTIPLFAIGFIPLYVNSIINKKIVLNIRFLLFFIVFFTLIIQILIGRAI